MTLCEASRGGGHCTPGESPLVTTESSEITEGRKQEWLAGARLLHLRATNTYARVSHHNIIPF
jgi:hypothetical protein